MIKVSSSFGGACADSVLHDDSAHSAALPRRSRCAAESEADGRPKPARIHEVLRRTLGGFGDAVLRLPLGADEQDTAALGDGIADRLERAMPLNSTRYFVNSRWLGTTVCFGFSGAS